MVVERDSHFDVQKPNGDVERHYFHTKAKLVKGLNNLTERQKVILELLVKNPYIEADNGTIYRMGVQIKSFVNDNGEIEVGPDLYLEELADTDIKDKMQSLEKLFSDLFTTKS